MLPINAFSIENFKSFGPEQRLPLKRLNFLFGPNSHGKTSSLIGLGVLTNSLLERNFKLNKIKHIDNSIDLNISQNLINNNSGSTEFKISCEIPQKTNFNEEIFIKPSFYLENLSGNGL